MLIIKSKNLLIIILIFSIFIFAENNSDPKLCKLRVDAAINLIKEEGEESAYIKFKDCNGKFRLGEKDNSYVWVLDFEGVMIMHPVNPFLEGRNLLSMRDQGGTYIIAEFINICEEKGEGWLQYVWPEPGKTIGMPKSSFVKVVKVGERALIVGCGIYNITAEELKKQFPNDYIVYNEVESL